VSPAELKALKDLVAAEEARQSGARQLSDTRIDDADALGREPPMCEIKGPYKDRKKWRVRIVDTLTGKQSNRIFSSQEEAEQAIPVLEAQYRRPIGVQLSQALEAYQTKLQTRQRKPTSRSAETAIGRIKSVVVRKLTADADLDAITGEVGIEDAKDRWDAYATRRTHSKRPPSVDSQINTLKALRAFWAFLVKSGWAKVDVWGAIEVEGQRKAGKPRLKKDDAKALKALALQWANDGDEGAIAALMALYLGLRAGEIVDRLVGDIDAGGTELVVDKAKTQAGDRTLIIPDVLQPLIAKLTSGKKAEDRLFPGRDRHWAYREIVQLCKDAGVKRVTPHRLRGTASSIAQTAGMIGNAVAASLGHESYQTTLRHYTDPSAPANAQIARVVAALN
jgi:integrase